MCDRTSVTPDFLWPEEKLALEYDSSEFHARKGAPQAARDAARSNFLAIKGYRVLRVAAGNVSSLSGAALLVRQIAFALGAPLREPTPLESQPATSSIWSSCPRPRRARSSGAME